MEEHARRAEELAILIAARVAVEGLTVTFELEPYSHGCMVHMDVKWSDATVLGLTLTVSGTDPDACVQVLDPDDYDLPAEALPRYALQRTRGKSPREAFEECMNDQRA